MFKINVKTFTTCCIFIHLFLLNVIYVVEARDSLDKIAKKFFVNNDKPQWQRTQAPREEIAIICHLLSLGPIECQKYSDRETNGANPGHEDYLGFFIQYGMFGAVAFANLRPSIYNISPTSNLEPLTRVEKQKISEVIKLFKVPKKIKNIQLIENCIFDINSHAFKFINGTENNGNNINTGIPTTIALKISFHSSYTRELFYTSVLSKQKYPIIPEKTYGRGKIQITPRTYCFKNEQNIVFNGILITEKIEGITLQVLLRWLTSYEYLNWISSSKNIKELQKRLDNRAEILWNLIHSFFSTLTSLYIHSEFGYLVHCDLNTGNIQIANTGFKINNSNYQENVDSLLKLTPLNIKILDFGTTRSTIEVNVRNLKCNLPNDMWRIKLIVTRLFKLDETTHPNLQGWTIDFQNTSIDQSINIKRSKIQTHMKSLDLFREELMLNNDFKNSVDLNSTFESIIDGLDSICDITVNHITKFKEQAMFIVNRDRYYTSCSPLDPSNARVEPIRAYTPDILGKLQIPLFPEKSASIKKSLKEEKQKLDSNANVKMSDSAIKMKDPNTNISNQKSKADILMPDKPIVQGGFSPNGIHGIGIATLSNSNNQAIESNIGGYKISRPDSNVVASSIGILPENQNEGQADKPIFIEDKKIEQEKISKITSLKQVCVYVEQSKSREARKWLNRLKMKNSVLRDITVDILNSVNKADKIIQNIISEINKKNQQYVSVQEKLDIFQVNRSKLLYIAKSCPITLNKIDEENSEATEKVNVGIIAFENERQRILKRCEGLRNFVPKNDVDSIKASMKTNEIIERGKSLLQYRFHINDALKYAFELLYKGVRRVQRLVELSQESMKGDLLLEENLELLLDKIAEYKA
ncbi:hypothetical protein FG386_000835 [Cryptosporidium ryanae]|uniref:uncharacterized protein n=1 Tax=Cryptosporidium ryanae TaxID=515981 RepID=UPI00351A0528|nr:hypothetical protein FG386_000835 [Cryptosporidium ryanae]